MRALQVYFHHLIWITNPNDELLLRVEIDTRTVCLSLPAQTPEYIRRPATGMAAFRIVPLSDSVMNKVLRSSPP